MLVFRDHPLCTYARFSIFALDGKKYEFNELNRNFLKQAGVATK